MKKLIMISMVSLMLVSGCSTSMKEPSNKDRNVCSVECDTADMGEYETFKEKNHVFLEINFQQGIKLLEDKTFSGIIYVGYPACPWCIEAVPIMNNVAKSFALPIYYINKKSDVNIADEEGLKKLTNMLDKAYGLEVKEKTNEPTLFVPEVLVVKKGVIESHYMGTVEGHDSADREMNKDEIKLLESIYRKMFKSISK